MAFVKSKLLNDKWFASLSDIELNHKQQAILAQRIIYIISDWYYGVYGKMNITIKYCYGWELFLDWSLCYLIKDEGLEKSAEVDTRIKNITDGDASNYLYLDKFVLPVEFCLDEKDFWCVITIPNPQNETARKRLEDYCIDITPFYKKIFHYIGVYIANVKCFIKDINDGIKKGSVQ